MRKTNQLIMSVAWVLLSVSPVAASSGTVTGKLRFYQHQGNYCPTTRNCTGAKYPQSQYHTNRPVQNTLVYVIRQSTEGVVGIGTTDSNGDFSLSWSDPSAAGSILVRIQWFGFHKDGRFYLANSTGGVIDNLTATNKWLSNGTTTNLGNMTWGNSTTPNAFANLYDGAHMEWANGLSQSNRMVTFFSSIQVRAFDSTNCSTSCADGALNLIKIDAPGSSYAPQARIMHEMGHIASYKSSYDNTMVYGGDYFYDGNSGWGVISKEWGAVQFEEAMASHFANLGLYSDNAVAPHTCYSSSACATDSFNIETSTGTSCGVDVNRYPINAERYFWDTYDSVVDSNYADTLTTGPGFAADIIQFMLPGTDNHQKDEPWNATYSALDDKDGRSTADFSYAGFLVGADTSTQLANNCGSPGD